MDLSVYFLVIVVFSYKFLENMFYKAKKQENSGYKASWKFQIADIPLYISIVYFVYMHIFEHAGFNLVKNIFGMVIAFGSFIILYFEYLGEKDISNCINTTFKELPQDSIYKIIRYPTYLSSVLLIFSIGVISNVNFAILVVLLSLTFYVCLGSFYDKSLCSLYPEYREYVKKSKLIIPYIF
jgi:protein-S-isoprenylcysteine O-methyltransferase Ste14